MLPECAKIKAIEIVNSIADGDIHSVLGKCEKSRLSILDIEEVLSGYGRTFVHFPSDGEGLIDAVEIINSSPPAWAVRTPLWTIEEARSDLTLELTMAVDGRDVSVELDDLRVL